MSLKRLLPLLLVLVAANSCRQAAAPQRGFYYWKTRLAFTETDTTYLSALGVESLYLRFFDIAWDEPRQMAIPVGVLGLASELRLPGRVVPVVFITSETVEKLPEQDVPALAHNLCGEIDRLAGLLPMPACNELQLDCDWTGAGRLRYFQLIRAIANEWQQRDRQVTLTATIRLHQIRHAAETGIPPVARGVLMAYNTSSPTEFSSQNAILELAAVKGYLRDAAAYPLPLDLALPLFSWAVQYDLNQRFVRLLKDVPAAQLEASPDFQADGQGRFRALHDSFLSGKRIMAEDLIEVERVDLEQLLRLAEALEKSTKKQARTIILFDYDSRRIEEVTRGRPLELDKVFAAF